jgi:hypothetical protein
MALVFFTGCSNGSFCTRVSTFRTGKSPTDFDSAIRCVMFSIFLQGFLPEATHTDLQTIFLRMMPLAVEKPLMEYAHCTT